MEKKKQKVATENIIMLIIVGIIIAALVIRIIINIVTSVDIKSPLVTDLYSKIGSANLEYCSGLVYYNKDEVSYDTLDEQTRLCLAYKSIDDEKINTGKISKTKKSNSCLIDKSRGFKLDSDNTNCSVSETSYETLKESYHSFFNKELPNLDNYDFKLSGFVDCFYNEDEEKFICGESINPINEIGWTPTSYRVVTVAKKYSDSIIIYDKFIGINDNICYADNFGNTNIEKCSKKLDIKAVDVKFVKKYGQDYMHTFKKTEDGSYYWVSSKQS